MEKETSVPEANLDKWYRGKGSYKLVAEHKRCLQKVLDLVLSISR